MDLHHLKIFVSVFKNRSFTRASEQLLISQPTVSEHIRNLEAELGINLFDRTGRVVIPTEEAERFYPRALRILDDVEKLKSDIVSTGNRVEGNVVVGASTIPGTYHLPSMAVEFKRRHPAVSFEIRIEDSEKISKMVLDHHLLLGVVGARLSKQQLDFQPIIEDELVLVTGERKGVLRCAKNANELLTLPFLIREKGSGTRRCMEGFLAQAGIEISRLDIVATLGSTASVKEAVKSCLGVSILSRLAVAEELARGQLREIPISGLTMKRDFFMVRHTKRTLPLHYQLFSEYLMSA